MKATSLAALQHIPGQNGLPFFGDTFTFVRNAFAFAASMHKKHGPVVRTNILFDAGVMVCDPNFAESFLLDKDRVFSSEQGWSPLLEQFFAGGLMLRDFDVHKLHRRIMQVAFKREALSGYLTIMRPILERAVQAPGTHAYRWIKQVTLDSACAVFLGIEAPDEMERVNQLFTNLVVAAGTPFRLNVPGTAWARGLRSRKELHAWLAGLIPSRRTSGGHDMLSLLCTATTEEGERFSDDDIVRHLVFLLMAAHDTTTSALTSLMMELGRRPELQTRLREQSLAIGPLTEEALPKLQGVYDAFREVLRLYPPVRSLPRRTLKPVTIGGHAVPANTQIWLNIEGIQRHPDIWTHPETFDPDRFSDARAEHKRHRFGWIPFGGGAHTCLGLQFSELQVRAFMHLLLPRYEWTGDAGEMQYVPFIKPKNDLPLRLRKIA